MKILQQFIVDSFAQTQFQGNPTAVCLLDEWLPDHQLQAIAQENHLSETAFIKPYNEDFALRWFTPTTEIDLCGQATLAAAFVVHQFIHPQPLIRFHTAKSGLLTVQESDGRFILELPSYPLTPYPITDLLRQAIGCNILYAAIGRDLICELADEAAVRQFVPNAELIRQLDGLLLHITAPCTHGTYDCISRSFAPKVGVLEGSACASGHSHLFSYWAAKTAKRDFVGYQASARGSMFHGTLTENSVLLSGNAVLFAKSEIYLHD